MPKGMTGDVGEMDPAALERLVRMGGNKLAVEMIDLFFDFAPKILAEARTALPTGDLATVGRVGHTLRSSAQNLGALQLRTAAEQLEQAAREQQAAALPALLTAVEAAFLLQKPP